MLVCEPVAPCSASLNLLLFLQPTETERCIESLLAVFQRYAGREGDNCTLSKKEFLAFMNTELAAFTKVSKTQARSLLWHSFSPWDTSEAFAPTNAAEWALEELAAPRNGLTCVSPTKFCLSLPISLLWC